jgi:hypothetical protein
VGERGASSKGVKGVQRWPENARTWAHPRRECTGERLGTGPDGWGSRASEGGRARARRETVAIGLAHRATGGREGERDSGRDRLTCGAAYQRVQARAGWVDWAGLGQIGFPFFLEFLMLFYFIFPRVFNSNSNQVSNSN